MFKQLTAAILLLAFTVSTFNKAAIVVGYFANTAAFAKNCENKAKPQLHCNGRCQMMKKLKQEEKKETRNPERSMKYQDEVLSSRSFFASLSFFKHKHSSSFADRHTTLPEQRSNDIFHPPGV